MLSEEKIKLMCKAAAYEQRENKKALQIINFYRKDYISFHVIVTWLQATVGFAIATALLFVYHFESVSNLLTFDKLGIIVVVLTTAYIMFCCIYIALAINHYSRLYDEAELNVRRYKNYLKRLKRIYDKESGSVSK